MKHHFVTAMTVVLTAISVQHAAAQQLKDAELKKAVAKMLAAYSQPQHLSFAVHYSYTHEATPGERIDSMNGQVRMHGTDYYYAMAGTKTIKKDTSFIILFGEDKLMYVTHLKNAAMYTQPISALDSFARSLDRIKHTTSRETQGTIAVQLFFPQGAPYKSLEFSIDETTGYVSRLVYHIDNTTLDAEGNDVYASDRIEARFTDYSLTPFDTDLFETSHYYTKVNGQLKVSPSFQEYTLFSGTPNL